MTRWTTRWTTSWGVLQVGEGHLRFSYVRSMEELKAGMDKFEQVVDNIIADQANGKSGKYEAPQ